MNHYWISWMQPTDDHRPLTYPPNESVWGWWNTGERCEDGAKTLVAHVTADSTDAAKSAVLAEWPEATEWRFCNETDSAPPCDRFPLSDWMCERFGQDG